jgi:predicted amidophosphoribosyltransferase
MVCPACSMPSRGLCRTCERSLRPAPPRMIDGVEAFSAYAHVGAAVRLVHNLKYRRCRASGLLLVDAMARLSPSEVTCVVPVRRSLVRRIRYGIDPSTVLAIELARRWSVPVVDAVSAPPWWRRRAGMDRARRGRVPFRLRVPVPIGAVLVDDVLTSGSTVASIIALVPHRRLSVVSGTSAGTIGSRAGIDPVPGGDVSSDRPAAAQHLGIASVVRWLPPRIPTPRHVDVARHVHGRSTGDRSRSR